MIKLEHVPLPRGSLVLAAVSGGADSVALLSLLRERALCGEIRLSAAHFEHGIRGEASRGDAAFVRALCAGWGVPLFEGASNVPRLARERGVGLEQAARDARYAFLRRVARETGAACVALAHHMDDQAETVLMHLLRGAGLRGVGGMAEREGDLWRPLLGARKAELVDYLAERGIPWREDVTNRAPDNPRNALRLRAMPALEAAYPGGVRAIARFARIAREEDECLAALTRAFLRARAERVSVGWRLEESDEPRAIVRRAVHMLTGLDADACEAACALYAAARGRVALPGGLVAEKTGRRLYLLSGFRNTDSVPLPAGGTARLAGVGEITVSPAEPTPRDDPFRQALDADSLAGACVRTRRPGDVIRPLGMTGTQKLSDYFINRRVDRPMRDAVLLAVRGSLVLWAAGVGVSEDAKLRKGSRAALLAAREYRGGWGEDGYARGSGEDTDHPG